MRIPRHRLFIHVDYTALYLKCTLTHICAHTTYPYALGHQTNARLVGPMIFGRQTAAAEKYKTSSG